MSDKSVFELKPITNTEGFSGRAGFTVEAGVLEAGFKGGEDSYVVRFELPCKFLAAGVRARIRLRGWQSVRYAAIGYTEAACFKHIKASNIRQDAWIDLGFTHQDVIWKLQNGMEETPDTEIKDIRFFVKGMPSEQGAVLEIADLAALESTDVSGELKIQPVDARLLETRYAYLRKGFRDYSTSARAYMETGQCPMPGSQLLNWPPSSARPEKLEVVNTYRFAWHGLHPVINLLLYAEESGEVGPIFAARTLIDNWLDQSYYSPDLDIKFAWYDHGTAERLLAFILMWAKALELGFDHRFMRRLGEAIVRHARLLSSEAFYAYHQPDRYHNHAWFQDAALVAVALAFPDGEQAQQWLENAISRFEDQLGKLIIRDGGFAIFIENSIGYHHGVQRLAELVGALVTLSGRPTDIPDVARELVAWSEFLRYPDGRVPAQGDTFRLPPRTGTDIRRGKPWSNPGCTVLPKAGYAVVKGNHDGKPWMLCMFATSLSKTHKHEDNLSITFWFDGIEWLIDPSFYSHEYQQPLAAYLRSAEAHNTIAVLGKQYENFIGYSTVVGSWQQGGNFELQASSRAYEGIVCTRNISGVLEKVDLSVVDEVKCTACVDEYSAQTSFHFSESVEVEFSDKQLVLSDAGSRYRVFIRVGKDSGAGFEMFVGDKNIVGQAFMSSASAKASFVKFTLDSRIEWSVSVCDS